MSSILLFKPKNLLEQNEKIGIFKRFFRAENFFSIDNQSILTDIWTQKPNPISNLIKEEKLALFQVDSLRISPENPCILIGDNSKDCWVSNINVEKSFFKNLKIIPLFQASQKKNINEKATKFFRKHYQTHWQNQSKLLQKSWNCFFDTDNWEQLKIKENLAYTLKEWIFWIENENNYQLIQENLLAPTPESEKLFDKLKRKLEDTQRKFEKTKEKECKEEESKEILDDYFEKTENSLSILENFWESNEIIYEKEIKNEDIFYYAIKILFDKTKGNTLSSPTFFENIEIPLVKDFFEYAEKGKTLFDACNNFQIIPNKKVIKVKNIVRTNEFIKRTLNFLPLENKIIIDEEIMIENVPDFFWTHLIKNKTFAQRINKVKNTMTNDEIIDKIEKYISFFSLIEK